MKTALCMMLFLFIDTQIRFEPGEKLDNRIKIINHNKFILTSSASIEKAFRVEINGCKYNVTLNPNRTIKAIFTNDKKFSTADNIRVGDSYAHIKNKLGTAVHLQPGWAIYYISKSGWKVSFDYRYKLTSSSKVQFLFKD